MLSIPRRFFGFRLGRRFGGLRSLVLGSSFVLGAFRVRGIVAAPVALRRRGFVAALALRTSGSFTVVGRLAVEQLGEAARLRADGMVLRARATRTGQGTRRRENLGFRRHTCHGNASHRDFDALLVCKPWAIGRQTNCHAKSEPWWQGAAAFDAVPRHTLLGPGKNCLKD
ncbi:MAG: hypothetical protein ABWY66_11115 [Xanthobacteraceae bacterium]